MSVSVVSFTLKDQHENDVRFAELAGKKFLLSFHPLAWTTICTRQMMDLELLHDKFMDKGIIPFGVSVDSLFTKRVWGVAMMIKKLQMLADFWPHGALAQALGCFVDKAGISGRANYLIGPDGNLLWSKVHERLEQPDFEAILTEMP